MDRMGSGLAPMGKGRDQAHLVGLDGSSMSGLAQMLVQGGYLVTGSIPTAGPAAERLRDLGVRVHAGHAPRVLPRSARLLVYGSEVAREHPDRLTATRTGVVQASWPEILGGLIRRGIGVAATGGRRAGVTAAMVGWALTHAGLDPTVVLGAGSPQLGGSGRFGRGKHVVIDAGSDVIEAGLTGPDVALLVGDDGPSARLSEIHRWIDAAPPGGYVLGLAGAGDATEVVESEGVLVERFSLEPGHAWWGADLREERGRYRFRAFYRGRFAVEVRLQVPGRHHVLGALAAVAACGRVDLTARAIKEALEEFDGVSRGFESRGSYRGVTLVDDEAIGTRAVAEALEVAREVFGRRRICAVFRPDPRSTQVGPAAAEFTEADLVLIIDEEGLSGGRQAEDLALAVATGGKGSLRAADLDGAIRELDRYLEPGDVLVTLGAGDVGTIADAFLRRLSRDRHD
ncbi:Mur ligase domain-containing protein [Tundrisphaera lichenicola]|uniref:Mur ligase domain-containing protein n=1 Tax=Tundrisphaera lichenicola TaxID=2029860 RepID=UPI003EBA39A9